MSTGAPSVRRGADDHCHAKYTIPAPATTVRTFANVLRMVISRIEGHSPKAPLAPMVSRSGYARLTTPLTVGEECVTPTGRVFAYGKTGFA